MMKQSDSTNQIITLENGRKLGFAEFGRPEGVPVFFFHGFPGSRLDWFLFNAEETAVEMNARIIVVDRPGMGLSDFQSGRMILDWPADVIEVADVLQINRFSLLAASGGAPYGLACAHKIPDRLKATTIVSGMGPADAPGAKDGSSWSIPGKPSLLRRVLLTMLVQGLKKPERMLSQTKDSFSGPDAALIEVHPEIADVIIESWGEAFRAGIGGVNHDAGLYTRSWGFQLQDVTAPVHLWHGGQGDGNVLASVGRYVADSLPNCKATFLEDEGHFSMIYNHMEDILSLLAA